MEKLNIAELLKDCPKGMALDCTIYEDVTFEEVRSDDTLYYNYSHKAGASYTDCYLSHNLMPKDSVSGKFVDAPTISQVLKWLREEKKIYLELVIEVDAEYMCDIYKFDVKPIECIGSTDYFKTYELAALAGIKYTLDNLI